MASPGFFLGGLAEGARSATEMRQADELLGLRRDTLSADTALRSRGLDIQQQQVGLQARQLQIEEQSKRNTLARQVLTDADAVVSDGMATVSDTISKLLATGQPRETVINAVRPAVDRLKAIAGKAGRDPALIENKVALLLAQPSAVEAAAGEGKAAAAKTIAATQALQASGVDTTPAWKTLDEKVKAENALRDDYLKQAKDFITIRDAKNRIDSINDSGAGDVALIFSYMKLLDPGSTVREGEFATIQNSVGVVDTVRNAYNKALTGERLPEKLRKDIREQAGNLYGAQEEQHKKTTSVFKDIAKRNKLDVDNVIVDVSPAARPKKPAAPTVGDLPPPPPGFNLVP